MREARRVAEPGDLRRNETGGRIDLTLGDHPRDSRHRGAHRQPLKDAQLALRRRAPRRAFFRRGGRPGGGGKSQTCWPWAWLASRRNDKKEQHELCFSEIKMHRVLKYMTNQTLWRRHFEPRSGA
jgi:hypothetical protein